MSETSIIAKVISEIKGDMSDKEFADALKSFTNGEYAPSQNTIQKYRTSQREPSYKDLQTILSYASKHNRLSINSVKGLQDFFMLSSMTDTALDSVFHADYRGDSKQIKSFSQKEKVYPIASNHVPSAQDNVINVPVLGQVPAGYPTSIVENPEGEITIPTSLLSKGNYFFLKVTGESMRDVGIYDKDLVLVRFSQTAEDGQTIIARMNGDQVTCKKFYKTADGVILLPANIDFRPIKSKDVEIIGIVEKVLHNY